MRRSPLNEDVFAAPSKDDTVSHEEVKDLQAKIYKLFLQVILKGFVSVSYQLKRYLYVESSWS